MIFKFLAILIMLIGLIATVTPVIPGTLIVFLGGMIYGLTTNFSTFKQPVVIILLLLMLLAEGGSRWLRIVLTRHYSVSRRFSVDTIVGNIGGLIAAEALLGSIIGPVIWEVVVAKSWWPRTDVVFAVVARLAVTAILRMLCGLIMIVIIIKYIFI